MLFRKTWLAVAALAGAMLPFAHADLQQMVSETQRVEQFGGGFRIVWFIPTAYWRESFKNAKMTAEQSAAICKALDDYILVAVADETIGAVGGLTAVPREQMVEKISLAADATSDIKPVEETQLTPDVKNFLGISKPVMANMLGQFGSGLQFFCFPAKDPAGARLADVEKPGTLQIKYGEKSYLFRLPLGSLMPPRYDPQTGEQFIGNYVFSPFTGSKLVNQAPTTQPSQR